MDIIYQMKKNEQKLQARLERAEQKLQEREIRISQAGSIAEAALALNGIFEAAQQAADDYLRSVKASDLGDLDLDAWLQDFHTTSNADSLE